MVKVLGTWEIPQNQSVLYGELPKNFPH